MCFFTETEDDLVTFSLLANAADLRDSAAAATQLLHAFLTLTGERSPLHYVAVRATTTDFVISSSLIVPFSKEFPPGYTQYKFKNPNPPHWYIVYVTPMLIMLEDDECML